MSHYDTEENNLAQHIEGFACGYDKNDDQYVLTPEDTDKDSEMNDSMYEESETVQQPAITDTDADEPEVAPSSAPAPVTKSSVFCFYYWLVDPANRMKVLLGLALLVLLVYVLHSQGMFTLPSVPSVPRLGPLDSATSSFTGSSSLGKNVVNMARNFQ